MEAVVAAPSHQVDVVLEVSQTVPLGDLPQGLTGLFLIAKDQAVDHFGIGNGPAFDRPHAAHGGQYHRYQQAHNLHVAVVCFDYTFVSLTARSREVNRFEPQKVRVSPLLGRKSFLLVV